MQRFIINLPEEVHEKLREKSFRENVSMSSFAAGVLAEYLGVSGGFTFQKMSKAGGELKLEKKPPKAIVTLSKDTGFCKHGYMKGLCKHSECNK